ncbi:hypothetical protein QO179_24445 [Bacillus stercoris]|nr:hypothetical protein [Bacillus stercoris]
MKLVDGSLTNNLPANILKLMGAEKIISIDLSKRNPSTYQVSGIANILSQTVSVLVDQIEYLSLSKMEDVIKMSVDVTDIGLLDFNQIQECYEKGYEYGKSIASFVKSNIEG